MCRSRGWDRVRSPYKNQKTYRVFLQYRSGSPEKSQLPSQHLMLGHHRHASETPFYGVSLRHFMAFRCGPLIARLWWYFDPPSPHFLTKNVKVGPLLTKLSGSAPVSGSTVVCNSYSIVLRTY